ncbi:19843_t:CDS:2 [Funneliformis geosporum]|uniref:5714_t:CDS:1 n=1 Tax=Funneliformis geosporum TaxID=1117311 RepID=A0A9W4SF74_9GLOM|nr:19843_t:CDS:2 [Funneliformis geosporum]CAI2167261.1 5714_t:CDS:2 [Funneliformis geosporum]
MWLNRNTLFATTILVVLSLFFSSSVSAEECQTITKTRAQTKTISPTNCASFTTTTTTATATKKPVICVPDKVNNNSRKRDLNLKQTYEKMCDNKFHQCNTGKQLCKNEYRICNRNIKCKRVVHCTPTVFLECPKAQIITLTADATTTTTTTTTATFTTTAVITNTVCRPDNEPCQLTIDDVVKCCSQCCISNDGGITARCCDFL